MATFTINTSAGSNLASFYEVFLANYEIGIPMGVTATGIGFAWGSGPLDTLILTGSGFVPGESPHVSGTATGMSFHSGVFGDYASISGLSFGPSEFLNEFDGGTYQSLLDFLGSGHTFICNSGSDVIMCGSGDDTAYGQGGRDNLMGLYGEDILLGGDGRDTLRGGEGADDLHGEAGADRFRYGSVLDGNDAVHDFESIDTIIISARSFGGRLSAGQTLIDGKNFISGTDPTAETASGAFYYDTDDKTLSWDADGSGDNAPVLLFYIIGSGAVTADDFRFY